MIRHKRKVFEESRIAFDEVTIIALPHERRVFPDLEGPNSHKTLPVWLKYRTGNDTRTGEGPSVRELHVTDEGIHAVFCFGGKVERTFVPWECVIGLITLDGLIEVSWANRQSEKSETN